MAQFDANVNLRVNVQEANKQLNKVERRLRQLERGTISRNKRNQGLASNLITGSKAAGANVGARLSKQNLDAQKKALRVADARVEKEIRLAAALQRQETILKALTRAGGTNSKAAQDRVDDALKASKEAKTNLGIQQAVNTLLEKELQIRREINRVANASNEAKSVGNKRGREIRGLKLPAKQEKELLELNKAYVTAAEKGQTDIAKAINRKVETELKGLRKIAAKREGDQKKADSDAIRGIRKRENEEKRAATKRQRDRSKLTDNIGAAAGFPLLFGGGAGSVVGGVAGAGIGSLLGAGFGVSILGSAIGQAFDKLAAAALDTAKAFDNVADNLDVVLKKLGESNSTIGARASFISGEGFTNQAAAAVQQRAIETLGNAEVQRKKELAKSARELDNALERLGLTFQGWITGPLKALADLISRTQPKPEPTAEQKATGNVKLQESRIRVLEQAEKLAKARGGALSAADQKRLQTYKDQLAVLKEQAVNVEGATKSERILLDLTRTRLQTLKDIGQAEVSVAERALTERRDVLAGDKGDIAVRKAQSEVTRLRGERKANKENGGAGATARDLQLQKDLNEALAKLGIARANASNNVLKAERQINAELEAAEARAAFAVATGLGVQGQLDRLNQGTLATEERRLVLYQNQRQIQRSVLVSQQELAVLYVREEELKQKLILAQERELQLFDRQTDLEEKRRRATTFDLNDRQTAIEQSRELLTLEAKINAERQIRATDPEYMLSFSGAGLGFFSESAKLEADQIADRTSQLEKYNEQLALLKQRLEAANAPGSGASGDTKFNLDQKIKDLEILRNNYESLQPAIDQAALAQARFNDAFAAVSPAVNSLVGGLQEVVAGTKTAEEAFADFLKTVADQLIQTAATMIAQYIAIGIAKAFAGMSSPQAKGAGAVASKVGSNAGSIVNSAISGFAEGGYVTGPTPAMVGEGGEPEYVIPASKMSSSLSRYSAGARGDQVLDNSGPATSGGGTAVADAPTEINISGGVMQFGGEEFIRKDQLPSIVAQASKAGEARTMRRLQMSPSSRSRVGL